MKSWRLSGALCFSIAAVACSDPATQGPGEPLDTEPVTESDGARGVLAELRERHQTLAMPADEHELDALPAALVPVLPGAVAGEFLRSGSRIRPHFETSKTQVSLPARSNGAFRLEAAESRLAVEA